MPTRASALRNVAKRPHYEVPPSGTSEPRQLRMRRAWWKATRRGRGAPRRRKLGGGGSSGLQGPHQRSKIRQHKSPRQARIGPGIHQ
eukprot:8386907-Pyramimonas_sp.AAC.1